MTDNDDTPHLVWIRVRDAAKMLWQGNPKLHDIGGVCQSVAKYGFQELPKFDKNLTSIGGEQGAIVAGNGRIEALAVMETDSRYSLPRGLQIDNEGNWLMPIVYGVDAESEAMAQAYAIDSNNLTMSGGDLTALDMSRAWDQKKYLAVLAEAAKNGQEPITVDKDTLGRLQEILTKEPPESGGGSGSGGQRNGNNVVVCPNCGTEFTLE